MIEVHDDIDRLQRFRERLVLEDGRTYEQAQAPFQVARFLAWDVGRRVYCESCVRSSKSTDVAAWILSWCALVKGWESLIYAVDHDQAANILKLADGFLRRSTGLRGSPYFLEVQRNKIRSASAESSCVVESSDVASAEGLIADAVICEQLESWPKEELWEAIAGRIQKRGAKLIVIANAPQSEDDWAWKVRDDAVSHPESWQWFTVTADQVPWITKADIDEARRLLPRQATFMRQYYNVIGCADSALFTPEQAEALCTLSGPAKDLPVDIRRVILALDMGLTHDLAALVALGERVDGSQDLLNMATWQGSVTNPVKYDDVLDTVAEFRQAYGAERMVYDWWQFEQAAQALRAVGFPCEKYDFNTKSINDLANQLWRRGVDGGLRIYRGAGALPRGSEVWDLAREMRSVKMVETPLGFKLETKGSGTKDRVIALGMASLWLQRNMRRVAPGTVSSEEFLKMIGM